MTPSQKKEFVRGILGQAKYHHDQLKIIQKASGTTVSQEHPFGKYHHEQLKLIAREFADRFSYPPGSDVAEIITNVILNDECVEEGLETIDASMRPSEAP